MQIFEFLPGLALAALLFAALLWSLYRAVLIKGRMKVAYIILTLSTLLVMAAITLGLNGVMVMACITLCGSALIAIWAEQGWSKLFPLVQFAFGILAVSVLLFYSSAA